MRNIIGVIDLGDGMRFTQDEITKMESSQLKELISLCDEKQAKRIASWTNLEDIKEHVRNVIDNINRPSRF